MSFVDFQWLANEGSFKEALQSLLGCSGQLLKKNFSSAELHRQIKAKDVSRLPLDLVNHLQINPVYTGPELTTLKETKDFLALHKAEGIHSHPLSYTDTNTVLNFLCQNQRYGSLKIHADHYDRGLIYRLDFETSGVLILGKTSEFHALMRAEFDHKMKRKLYLAVVEGEFDQEGSWTHYFSPSGVKGSKQKVSAESAREAREGSFHVRKLMAAHNKSLVLVELKTGLRHQIRAQLAYLGFPILGDVLYGAQAAERLFLHAWIYEWDELIEDQQATLFDRFFDLNGAFQMGHDMLRILKSR